MATLKIEPRRVSVLVAAAALAAAALLGGGAVLALGPVALAAGAVLAAILGAAGFAAAAVVAARGEGGEEEAGSSAAIPEDRTDPVTGLANKNGFEAWFAENSRVTAKEKKKIIVIAADLADFQRLVQTRGREEANEILREAAKRVNTLPGESGVAARIEGEEFAALASVVPDRALEVAAEHAGSLAELLQRPVEIRTGVVWIGGSVGAAVGDPAEGLAVYEKAKEALQKARKIGRGHFFVDGVS